MTLLAAVIYDAVYVENHIEKRKISKRAKEDALWTIQFVTGDLKKNCTS